MTLCLNPHCPAPENSAQAQRCQGCGAKLVLGDRFRPIKLLGQGGFGRTVLAEDLSVSPPQPCVIKQNLRAQVDRDRFFKEADRLTQLGHHPQIPRLIAVLESSQGLCLVQSYVAGQTLAQVVTDTGPWREAQVRSLLGSLLPVLAFIHDHQVIHRDIKPANIILSRLPIGAETGPAQTLAPLQRLGDGRGTLLPVLVDFGAAKALDKATLEKTGTVIGSAGYAAPEQVLGKAVFASDLYGLGVTCLHLLTQQHPFDLYSALDDRWVWQPYAPYPASGSFTQILARLTARSLRSRYPTAAAALADLNPAGQMPALSLAPPVNNSWHCRLTQPTPKQVVQAISLSPNGRALATGHSDGTVQLWDSATGQVIHTWGKRFGPLGNGHQGRVTAVAFHPEGDCLWSGSQDGTLKQWDLADYRLRQTLDQVGWPITGLKVTEQQLVTATTDGHIRLWGLPHLALQGDWVRHQGSVTALALSPNGRRLASTGDDGTLRLWEFPSGQLLHTWTQPKGDRGADHRLLTVAFYPQGPYLVTGDAAGAVTVWSLENLERAYILSRHQDAVTAVACWPGGDVLATGSADGQIHLWQLETKRRIAVLSHDWAVSALAFDDQRPILVSSSADETLRIWQAESERPEP
ncbi:MAG: protein kinase [Cyanobacteria bacterium]|nr:protein kinase [Cyanobacteriota bacterium]MDA0867581.1 protein kinase [Cyanobacteriota bacterium]